MKIPNPVAATLPPPLTLLADRGWIHCRVEETAPDTVVSELGRLGDLLGTRTAARTGAFEEIVRPQSTDDAHPRSLSARYGLGALPFHAELSHRPRPCRYLLLGCIDPGHSSAATTLLDWRTLDFSPEELGFLEGAPVLVRTGRRSFYSTILSPDRAFVRYDPGCLQAVDERGKAALTLVEYRLANSSPVVHHWRRGDVLVIDNWCVLHGREPTGQGSARRLARILIDA